ncbi:hypothetical protein DPEC_G00274710 [Dallia pectoralis]|uniref:Uncharacterized protein n=1 Tax=Dallia pectoralis TaxID=75939 RepID=A0ACC2FL47_DALPE|nr:hypothetical protein DPEC_G00274710 [Dallia pectoralis]
MTAYTLNLRVFWPLFTCALTCLVLLHHIHEPSPESGLGPGHEAGTESCLDQPTSVLFSLIKLLLVVALCYLFIRYCSGQPDKATRHLPEAADGAPKSGVSRRDVLEDYYERWVHLSPHVLGHSKANVAKLVGELVRAGRATGGIPESSLAFRGDFLPVGSSYEEHKVGAPDFYDILVPLRVPRGLRLEPRVYRQEVKQGENGEKEERGEEEKVESKLDLRVKEEDKEVTVNVSSMEKGSRRRFRSSRVKEEPKKKTKEAEKMVAKEERKESLKEEVKEEKEEESKEEYGWSSVPRCCLETPRRGDWVRKHFHFTNTFLRLHQPHGSHRRSKGSSGGVTAGSGGDAVYRLTPDSVLRWFYPAVQRCLATVRYPFEQRCKLSLGLSDDRVQLRLTPCSDYVCCHISMAIRLLPAIPLGDGVYLVPMETTSVIKSADLDHQNQEQNQVQNQEQNQEQDLWTLFFPRQEQRLLGWLRGRSPQPSCHLKVLQLTKALRDLGGQALDSHRGALWRSVLSSYALKTAWLRLLLSTPGEVWEDRHLVARMEDLIHSLRQSLQNRALGHLFLGSDSSSILPDSVVLPKLVKEVVGGLSAGTLEGPKGKLEGSVRGPAGCLRGHSGERSGGYGGNLWAGVDPTSLDLVSGRLAYAWSHLHRLIRLGRPQRSSLGPGMVGNGHCLHQESGE